MTISHQNIFTKLYRFYFIFPSLPSHFMMTSIQTQFMNLENTLQQYYRQINRTDYNGVFLNWIQVEQLADEELPIRNEIGDDCNSNDCCYTWINDRHPFPIPQYLLISPNNKEKFIFQILQYCYKYQQSPNDDYIITIIAPKCRAGVIQQRLHVTGKL